MRNKIVAATIAGMAAAPAAANAAAQVDWFGFSQITVAQQGENANGDKGGLAFAADRIRIGYKAKWDSGVHSKLQVDFKKANGGVNQLPNIIKDAVVGYDFGTVDVQAGMRKTPIGMDFNTSGKKLDIVNRGMEKAYVLERTAGAFLFGDVGNFGWAAFVGNAATRSGAASSAVGMGADPDNDGNDEITISNNQFNSGNATLGEDYSYGLRGSYDMGEMLYAEASYGVSTNSGNHQLQLDLDNDGAFETNLVGDDAKNYSVFDLGVTVKPMPKLTLKGEYLSASNVHGVDDWDQDVWYLHGGYRFHPMMEGVIRHYQSKVDIDGGDADLGETYLGLNIFLNPEKEHQARIQLNYILPSGDDEASDYSGLSAGSFHNTGTVTDDNGDQTGTFKAMLQASF